MKKESQSNWISEGYKLFALEGPTGLKVEVLSKAMQKNKSSFYHLFVDKPFFISKLLDYHLQRSQEIAIEERNCKNIIPDLLNFLTSIKIDLLFNRQLRIHGNDPIFKDCLLESNKIVEAAILEIFARDLGLGSDLSLAQSFLDLSIENFYLQINEETLNFEWLEQYIIKLKKIVLSFQKNN